MIKFLALGTSGSFPTKERNHPSFYFEYKGIGMLFDCGEGTQRQMRKVKISPCKIKHIFITHWHGDHTLGLPGLFYYIVNSECKEKINIYGPTGIKKKIENLLDIYDIEDLKYNVVEILENGKILETEEFYIEALFVKHTTKTIAYSFKQRDYWRYDNDKLKKYELFGKHRLLTKLKKNGKVEFKGKKIKLEELAYLKKGFKFTYITDTLFFEDLIRFSNESDILLVESTYFNEPEKAREYFHLDFTDAIRIFEKSNSKIMLLTHLSQRYENDLEKILEFLEKNYKNVFLLKDFSSFVFEKNIITLKINNKEIKYKRDEITGNVENIK